MKPSSKLVKKCNRFLGLYSDAGYTHFFPIDKDTHVFLSPSGKVQVWAKSKQNSGFRMQFGRKILLYLGEYNPGNRNKNKRLAGFLDSVGAI